MSTSFNGLVVVDFHPLDSKKEGVRDDQRSLFTRIVLLPHVALLIQHPSLEHRIGVHILFE